MFSKVRVKQGPLNYFRRLARQSAPKEIQAYLLGNVTSVDQIEVTDFIYTKDYHTQTNGSVCWTAEEYKRVLDKALEEGKKVVGDLHSHPNWDAVMSPADYNGAIIDSLWLCGICSIYDGKTRVRFWTPTSALPCKVTYY